MPNNFISAPEYAKQLGITPKRISVLCKQGRIPGAFKLGTGSTCSWVIPRDTKDPRDFSTAKGAGVKKSKP